jgi:hypothetical protein
MPSRAGKGSGARQKPKSTTYLETDEFAKNPPFLKKELAGVLSQATSGKNCSSSSFESTPLISDANIGISSISDTLLLRARDE